jgi:pimeloyl-ACP methyl ester carboxylesterase
MEGRAFVSILRSWGSHHKGRRIYTTSIEPATINSSSKTGQVVFSLHGIRTRGKWPKDVAPLLAQAGFTPVPLDYGRFLSLQLLRKSSRGKKIDWFRDEYSRQCERLGCDRPSIIAHSLGCYLLAEALEKYQQIRIDRAIVCGSIVRRQFPWKRLSDSGQVRAVLNQYGGNDFWARLVEWVVSDAGQSGLRGFDEQGEFLIQQEHSKFGHSDYFYDLNYKQNWIPFLQGKQIEQPLHASIQAPNWRFLITRAVVIVLLGCAVAIGVYWWLKKDHTGTALRQHQKADSTQSVGRTEGASGPSQNSSGAQSPNVNGTGGDVNIHYDGNPTEATKKQREKR